MSPSIPQLQLSIWFYICCILTVLFIIYQPKHVAKYTPVAIKHLALYMLYIDGTICNIYWRYTTGCAPFTFLVYGTQTYLSLKNFVRLLGFRMVIEILTFLSVFDKWHSGYYSDCPSEVIDYIFTGVDKHELCVHVGCTLNFKIRNLTPLGLVYKHHYFKSNSYLLQCT